MKTPPGSSSREESRAKGMGADREKESERGNEEKAEI